MSKTTRSIIDLVDSEPTVDNSTTFDQLWALLGQLKDRVTEQFELLEDHSSNGLQPYHGLPDSGGAMGYMSHYAGPKIDWLVHSWVGNPKYSFTNMHLTISVGAQYDVPHLGLAFGTTPDLFFYMDYMPRKDLWLNPDYVDKYYTDANTEFLALQNDRRFSSFISQDVYTRVAQSACSLCLSAPVAEDTMASIEQHSWSMLERWLAWLAEAEPQAEDCWSAQAERDLRIRRTITEKDPVNPLAERLFGQELEQRLVRSLWGADRTLARAHEW